MGWGIHVARGSSRMPLLMECCWQGAVWGQQQVLIPEAWLLSPLFPGSVPTARRPCTVISSSTTAPAEVSRESGKSRQGRCSQTCLQHVPHSCPSRGDCGVVGAPMAHGQDHRVGVEMSTCVCRGWGWRRVGCTGAALWVGKEEYQEGFEE